jgi:hypothetical protein
VIAQERRARARVILEQLEALAPELDLTVPHPDGVGIYQPNNPPLLVRTAALAGALCVELKALRITEAKFPIWRWDVASRPDLSRALRDTIGVGWPSITWPRERGPLVPDRRVFTEVTFQKIFAAWFKAVRNDLARHEQANNKTEQADVAA